MGSPYPNWPSLVTGMLIGLALMQFIANWALNKALNTMKGAVEFREECLAAVREIAEERDSLKAQEKQG